MVQAIPSRFAAVLPAAVLSGCALVTPRPLDLAVWFDCLRNEHLTVVAAHRGQPDPSAAENAWSSFTASHAAHVPFLEIDVATTRDGVLVLMHDDTLDRTTTGSEQVTEKNWPEIQTLKIKRPDGVILDERVPRFADGSHFVGSTATMPRTARLLREDVGLAEDEVRRLVSANPRRLLA